MLFDEFSAKLKVEIAHALFKFKMMMPDETPPAEETKRQQIESDIEFRTNLSLMPELEFTQEG
jgi:hypothetical protein